MSSKLLWLPQALAVASFAATYLVVAIGRFAGLRIVCTGAALLGAW
jgi:hypothetical protein